MVKCQLMKYEQGEIVLQPVVNKKRKPSRKRLPVTQVHELLWKQRQVPQTSSLTSQHDKNTSALPAEQNEYRWIQLRVSLAQLRPAQQRKRIQQLYEALYCAAPQNNWDCEFGVVDVIRTITGCSKQQIMNTISRIAAANDPIDASKRRPGGGRKRKMRTVDIQLASELLRSGSGGTAACSSQ